jgi:hypothetical protein
MPETIAPGRDFRRNWPQLGRRIWLNTPSIAPAANLVAAALSRAIDRCQRGEDVIPDRPSQIVVVRTGSAPEWVASLAHRGIVTAANSERLRVGSHAFNTEEDVEAVLAALRGGSQAIK